MSTQNIINQAPNVNLVAYTPICVGTTAAGPVQSVATVGTAGQVLTSNGAGALPSFKSIGSQHTVQQVYTQTGATASGTTVIPVDDTIPQITEGDEYMTLAITPLNAANILEINIWAMFGTSASSFVTLALFQDATADALTATCTFNGVGVPNHATLTYLMAAGTTVATTFRVRIGGTSGTIQFNGIAGTGRTFGGVANSGIMITEYST